MRLLLKLKATKTVSQSKDNNSKYFSAMHGWIYNKLKGTKFTDLHSKKEFKPFCFGNLYPINNQKLIEKNTYKILISSPIPQIMQTLFFNINKGEKIRLGEYLFELADYSVFENTDIRRFDILKTTNLINLTKQENNQTRPVLYTKDQEEFMTLLSENLIRKYNFFHNTHIKTEYNLFRNCLVSLDKNDPIIINLTFTKGNKQHKFKVIGNSLIFKIGAVSNKQLDILNFCYEIGFGERNTYGMGFMIKSRDKSLGKLSDFESLI